jgi:hypothetical protein
MVEAKTAQDPELPGPRARRLLAFHQILFALNIAYAFVFGMLLCIVSDQQTSIPKSDLGYYFRRSVIRIDDIFQLGTIHSVSTSAVARQIPNSSEYLGAEILVVVCVLTGTLLLLSILRLTAGSSFHKSILNSISGATALLIVPAAYLLVLNLTWPSGSSHTFWQDFRPLTFGAEVLCLALLAAVSRKRSLSFWTTGTLLFLHCAFWLPFLFPEFFVFSIQRLISPMVLIAVFPLSAVIWLLYRRKRQRNVHPALSHGGTVRWTFTALLAIAALLIIWRPGETYALDRPGNLDSLTIRMSRGPCRGNCSQYTLTIHGAGDIGYVGRQDGGGEVTHQSTLLPEQQRQILQALDRAKFFALEDRAFFWCFDTSSVAISVSIDGRTKEVVSDAYCDGAKSGRQAAFVRAASEIDAIVGTKKWAQR